MLFMLQVSAYPRLIDGSFGKEKIITPLRVSGVSVTAQFPKPVNGEMSRTILTDAGVSRIDVPRGADGRETPEGIEWKVFGYNVVDAYWQYPVFVITVEPE